MVTDIDDSIKWKKNGRKCRLRRLQVEFLENGLGEDHEILHAHCEFAW